MSQVQWNSSNLGLPETEMFLEASRRREDREQSLGVALPSGESASDVIEGVPGSGIRLVGHFLGRAVLLALGLAAVGLRDKELVKASLAGSAAIEFFVLGYAAVNREKKA